MGACAGKKLTGFLEPAEKDKIQEMYEKWRNHLNPDTMVGELYTGKLMSQLEMQNIEAKPTKMAKNSYIFTDILQRATYEDVSKIRAILIKTGARNAAHIGLAKMLPDRGESISFEPPVEEDSGEKYGLECTDQQEQDYFGHPDDVVVGAGKSLPRPFGKKEKRQSKEPLPSSQPVLENIERIQSYYGFKQPHVLPSSGKGLCVVIRNFTQDLKGYEDDAISIRNFFEGCLNYTVLEGVSCPGFNLVNVNLKQFEDALDGVVKELKKCIYDRFFLFILSHGDHKGIKMSLDGDGIKEELGTRFKVDDIIKKFTHFHLNEMKDYPKCIFIQACRGEGKTVHSADPVSGAVQETEFVPTPLPPMANGRDILVCYPAEAGHYAYVSARGSWFIQETIETMRKFYRSEHLLDILVEAAGPISSKISKEHRKSKDDSVLLQESVCQMPHYISTFTKKFYMMYPPL